MDSNKFKIILIGILSAFIAIYLGVASATAQFTAVGWVIGAITLAGLFALGKNIWVLIPFSLSLSGGLNFIPGSPSAWYIATPLVIGFMFLRFLMRAKDFIWRWTWMDTFVALNLIVLIQSYIRNPTGLNILGGSEGMIGGKTYIDFLLVTVGFFIVGNIKSDWNFVCKTIVIMISIELVDGLLGAATGLSSGLAATVSKFYSNVDFVAATAGLGGSAGSSYQIGEEQRMGSFVQLGLALGLICCTFWRPLDSLNPVRPIRNLLFLLSVGIILLSGFRSQLVRLAFFFFAGTIARRKPTDIILAGLFGILFICFVLMGGFAKDLPFAAQRALSFLPIGVSEAAKYDANDSSEWRFEMWRIALTTDRYIHNKLLGDGFGFTAAEFQLANNENIVLSKDAQLDFMMSKGSYHGFHVECIRFVGVIGLTIATCILVSFAIKSLRLIRYFEGRERWHLILFTCVPFLIEPIHYWLIFGSYKGNFLTLVLGGGLIKILDNIRIQELSLRD